VEQHKGNSVKKKFNPKRQVLEFAKLVEEKLPENFSTRLRLLVDASGITGFLTGKKHNNLSNQTIKELVFAA
jgi:hypothetical protein